VAAALAILGTVVVLSVSAMSHHLAVRVDQEIEKFRSISPPDADGPVVTLDEECLVLLLDTAGRVTKRYAGAPDMPAFPDLSVDLLDAYADRGHPAPMGTDGSYRALVIREPGGGYGIIARSMAGSRRAVTRLLQSQIAAALPLLAAVAIGSRRLSRREARERQQSEQRLREFLAMAGHELRNPLTTISGYAQLARLEGLRRDDLRDVALDRVGNEIARMTSLIDELVLLSRLDLNQPLQRQSVDLAQLCRDAVTAARDCHPDHPIRLLLAPGDHTVNGDPLRLHQVVANLLANARLHTPAGTRVTLGLGTEDGYRVIEVRDEGPGVPPQLRPRIFERFVRGEDTTAPGSGLGLGIVAAIAAAHGGAVALEPSDRGAWFRVRLPASS
jgi:signal transduction histidine kinase